MRLALALILGAGMAAALPPETSLRPVMRAAPAPVAEPAAEATGGPAAESEIQPTPEPDRARPAARRMPAGGPDAAGRRQAGATSLRPAQRPPEVIERAVAVQRERRRGAVCGDPAIQGDVVGRVPGRIVGCGIAHAVRVRSVAGIELTQRAVMDCGTAAALKGWVSASAKPALSGINGGLARLKVAAHYICRTRNGRSGARISEHGRGRAMDISGFYMRDGSLIDVERGWNARGTAQALREMHRDACGTFGTVLGPEADRFHRDHFHFDTAPRRHRSYCR